MIYSSPEPWMLELSALPSADTLACRCLESPHFPGTPPLLGAVLPNTWDLACTCPPATHFLLSPSSSFASCCLSFLSFSAVYHTHLLTALMPLFSCLGTHCAVPATLCWEFLPPPNSLTGYLPLLCLPCLPAPLPPLRSPAAALPQVDSASWPGLGWNILRRTALALSRTPGHILLLTCVLESLHLCLDACL